MKDILVSDQGWEKITLSTFGLCLRLCHVFLVLNKIVLASQRYKVSFMKNPGQDANQTDVQVVWSFPKNPMCFFLSYDQGSI